MKKLFAPLAGAVLACTVLAGAPHQAVAAPILDQVNAGPSSPFCLLGTGQNCGQSFQQAGGNIAGAGVYIAPDFAAGAGTLTLSIYSSYAGALGELLASATVAGVTSDSGWVDAFWTPVALAAGTTYYLVASSEQEFLAASYTWDAAYTEGSALLDLMPEDYYGDYDLAFRSFGQSAEVPEPGGFALFGAVLGACLLGRRSRKRL